MKLKFAFLLLTTAFLVSNCNGVSTDDAIAYNDTIVEEQEKILNKVQEFNDEESYELQVSLDLCKAISKQCDESIKVLKELKTIDGGESLKASAMAYFEFYKHLSENEYIEYSNLLSKEDYTDEDYDKAVAIEDDAFEKSSVLEDKIIADQKVFAKKYNYKLY